MRLDEYREYDMTALAELVAAREVTAEDLYDLACRAIEQVDAELNAVADGPWPAPLPADGSGPFAGVPFVLKDLLCHPVGVPMRLGTRLTGDGLTSDHDTHLMQRFRQAGLAIAALTTSPELGFSPTTEAVVYGPTRNPWDPSRSPGGSSGGTAALVAARAVPAGYANDSGGSIRIPAAACGLVGLKPSRGRVSVGPDAQEVVFGLAVEFALTRTVRDTAGLLDAVAGPMAGDKYHLTLPERGFGAEAAADPGRLRVAIHTASWAGSEVDPAVCHVVERVGERLAALGHQVEAATPEVVWDELIESQVAIWCASIAHAVTGISAVSGLAPGDDTLEHVTLSCYQRGLRMGALELVEALSALNQISRRVGRFFDQWDVLVTPTTNTPALPLGTVDHNTAELDPESWTRQIFDLCSFTPLFNITGTPAISLPLGFTDDRLPVGVQFAAGMGEEALLLRLASQLEAVMPWADQLPPVRAGSASTTEPADHRGERR